MAFKVTTGAYKRMKNGMLWSEIASRFEKKRTSPPITTRKRPRKASKYYHVSQGARKFTKFGREKKCHVTYSDNLLVLAYSSIV